MNKKQVKSMIEKYNKYYILHREDKDYYYISTDNEVLCDLDGEPYHFDTWKEANEFLLDMED